MTGTVVLSDGGPQIADLEASLAAAGAARVRHIGWRRPVGPPIAALDPELIFIDEPAWSPLPLAVIREARSAAPEATVLVRVERPTANWLVDAQLAGASAVLCAGHGQALAAALAEFFPTTPETSRLRWAA